MRLDRLTNERLIRYLLLAAVGWAIAQVLNYFSSVLSIFILASILAFLLSAPVEVLTRWMPRPTAAIVVFLGTLLLASALGITIGLAIVAQAQQLWIDAPRQLDLFLAWLEPIGEFLKSRRLEINIEALEEQLRQQALLVLEAGFTTAQRLLLGFVEAILVAVVAFFMLLDGERPWQWCIGRLPPSLQTRVPQAIRQNFLGFFWGRFLLSVFFGVSTFAVLLGLGVPYALVLAAIAGFFDLIPGIGATLGIGLVAFMALPQGIWVSGAIVLGCIVLQQIEENLLMPRIMQGSVNLNPVILFLALLVGAKIGGLLGLFLAIPLAGTVVNVLGITEMGSTTEEAG
ncbi:MAG: AI-2E family transporter [Oscillatoriales cyanobacterium SM2_1_8]|nr:AI-2E family transporter [Oscillatoriales cyanobacterium SM2_1_8]